MHRTILKRLNRKLRRLKKHNPKRYRRLEARLRKLAR